MVDFVGTVLWPGFGVAVFVAIYFTARWRQEFKESEWWTGIVVEGKKLNVGIDHQICMGSATCVELAPDIFRLDWTKRKSLFDPAPLEKVSEFVADADRTFKAAQSCPYRAIYIEDAEEGERIFP